MTTQPTPALSVQRYLTACDILRHEIRLSMDDLEARTSSDTEIHYLVDFSEIFSYAFPQQTLDPIHLFMDEDAVAMELLQRDALNNLFFGARAPAVLLPPYAVELQSQLARLRIGFFDDMIRKMVMAERRIEEALARTEVKGLLARLQRSTELGDDELRDAFRIFEKHAAELLLLHQHTDRTPYQKILEIVEQKRLVPLNGRFKDVQPHVPTRNRWHKRLKHDRLFVLPEKKRAEMENEINERSYIDGVAVGMLHALNEAASENVRFLFVTRSSHMHELFDEELKSGLGLWNRDLFRHPRSFASLFQRKDTGTEADATNPKTLRQILIERHDQLQNHYEAMDVFIHGTQRSLDQKQPLETDELFLQQIRDIRENWELSGVLATSPKDPKEAHRKEKRKRLMDVVRLLTEREAFADLLNKRVDQLLYDLEHGHDFLGFYAQSTAASDRDTLTRGIHAEVVDSNQAILTCRRYWVPHTLEFNTPELMNWASALQQKTEISWREILDFLRSNFSREADYERLLAMAYLLASLKKWDFAERFCRRAIGQSLVYDPPTVGGLRYEAHFFLAVCMRMHNPRPDRHRNALQQLDQASNQWRFQRYGVNVADVTLDDPRYLIERGNHIYRWNKPATQPASRKTGRKGVTPPPLPPELPIESALEAWTRALALIQAAGDNRLLAQVHNNLCFYYADAATPDIAKIREHLQQMIAAQSGIEKILRRWPPVFIHTVAVARHILYQQNGSIEDRAALESVAADLEWTLQNAELLEVHNESFGTYLTSIRETLRRS